MSAEALAGERIGGVIGTWLGRMAGAVFGPLGGIAGGVIGKQAGQFAGRAAGVAIASMMEGANEDAEDLSDEDAEATCADCPEIDCFNVPEGVDPEEFRRQLKEQQDAINRMEPGEIIENMRQYQDHGRPSGDAAARAKARNNYFSRNIGPRTQKYLGQEYLDQGYTLESARKRATDELLDEMADMDATHAVDLIAGGDSTVSGLGNSSVNRSIGSQWRHKGSGPDGQRSDRTRAQQLQEAAEKRRGRERMEDIKLEVCPDEGGSDAPADRSNSGGTPDNGTGTAGPVS